jgi:hypothetical protein
MYAAALQQHHLVNSALFKKMPITEQVHRGTQVAADANL